MVWAEAPLPAFAGLEPENQNLEQLWNNTESTTKLLAGSFLAPEDLQKTSVWNVFMIWLCSFSAI